MFQPQTYVTILALMVLSMLCWGSWANTRKLTIGYAFPLFYWDYVLGILLASLFLGFTFGSVHPGSTTFLASLRHSDAMHWLLAIAGGVIFNLANLLLVAAIDLAGMAVAFPVGIGLALIVGVVLNYIVRPAGNPILIFGGVALVAIAIVLDSIAYKRRERNTGISSRGVLLSIISGLLMGLFYPFVARAGLGDHALNPYSITFVFAIGVLLCSLPVNAILMRHSLTGERAVNFAEYRQAPARWHLWGIAGGAIWCLGSAASFVASNANAVGPAVSYAIGQGATMVSALWGVFIWKEFATAPRDSKVVIPFMFLFFIVGLAAVAIAPLIRF